jgi:hypothetical protein
MGHPGCLKGAGIPAPIAIHIEETLGEHSGHLLVTEKLDTIV